MRRTNKALVTILAAALVAGAACSSDAPERPDVSGGQADGLAGTTTPGQARAGDATASPLADLTISPPPFDEDEGGSGSSAVPGGETGEVPTLTTKKGSGARFASKSAGYQEPQPDAEKDGVTEDYAEATAVVVEGLGDSLRVTMTFAANLPNKMPTPDTYMVVGVGMSGKKEGENYSFGGQADDSGWHAYAGKKNESRGFPGTFFVRDNTVEMTVPWSFVGGPRPFTWYSSASWFRYAAGVTSYSFDVIPNGTGRYPK